MNGSLTAAQPAPVSTHRILTLAAAADLLGAEPFQVQRAYVTGRLPGRPALNGELRFMSSDLESYFIAGSPGLQGPAISGGDWDDQDPRCYIREPEMWGLSSKFKEIYDAEGSPTSSRMALTNASRMYAVLGGALDGVPEARRLFDELGARPEEIWARSKDPSGVVQSSLLMEQLRRALGRLAPVEAQRLAVAIFGDAAARELMRPAPLSTGDVQLTPGMSRHLESPAGEHSAVPVQRANLLKTVKECYVVWSLRQAARRLHADAMENALHSGAVEIPASASSPSPRATVCEEIYASPQRFGVLSWLARSEFEAGGISWHVRPQSSRESGYFLRVPHSAFADAALIDRMMDLAF